MKRLIYILLAMVLFSCGQRRDCAEQVVFDRLDYVYRLKKIVDRDVWKGVDDKRYDVPLVYYTDSCCFVVNPKKRFMDEFSPELVYKRGGMKVYKSALVDDSPFHMSVSVSFDYDADDFNYKSPYMKCSSLEIARTVIPDLNCTEEWMSMVMHEYFHGFQFRHREYLDYFEEHVSMVPSRALKTLYFSNMWFKTIADEENDQLLKAIASDDMKVMSDCIVRFFEYREMRRGLVLERLNVNIKTAEEVYETMEGTSRYVESELYKKFSRMKPDACLVKNDTSFRSFAKYKDYSIDKDPWLYDTKRTTYFYATGYNIIRLLDKLAIDYKSRLFKEEGLSLEKLLKSTVKK